MAVASTLSCMAGLRPPSTSRSKFGGISTTNVYSPGIHQRNDVALGDRLRRAGNRAAEMRRMIRRDNSE